MHRLLGWKFWSFVVGAAPLDGPLEEFWSRLGFVIVQGYGLTETAPVVTLNNPFKPARGSVGTPIAGVDVKIAPDGEILVRGANVTPGYFNAESETAAAFENGWFHTGDIGEMDASGRLVVRGRKKEMIVTPEGLNVFPDDAVERVLNDLPGVRDSAVVGVARDGEERTHAVLVLDPGVSQDDIVRQANSRLEEHQKIRSASVWTEDGLPRTEGMFKPTLATGRRPIISRSLGTKEARLVYADGRKPTRRSATPLAERRQYCLRDDEVLTLARWACLIEEHYSALAGRPSPMDIEWAKDGVTGELVVVQARPETVHSAKPRTAVAEAYRLADPPGTPLVTGQAVGERIGAGHARVVRDVSGLELVQPGDVLVAPMTDPDWEPAMRRVAAIVTDRGGRTAHAAIVSRELGVPCIVGAEDATRVLRDAGEVTVSCAEGAEGHVYKGRLRFEVERLDASRVPRTRTRMMLILADPTRAFAHALIPNAGVGLARIEFIVANQIGIHPMALARYPQLESRRVVKEIERRLGGEDPREFFVRRLAEGVGRIAAAFHPKPVIVRLSDFKTNEYAQLLGGGEFEPQEENPMLGFRGASRYDDARYADGFALECAAILRVRADFGLTNAKVMIPFCRTVDEGRRVIAAMARHGLRRHDADLEVYLMCELPSNVVLADEFLRVFDGYSIGSNDLTQLTLGLDRDSGTVARLFDERNDAVRWMIAQAIEAAKRCGKPIGICGQAPSDYPEFAEWLVRLGIDSISLNPDVAMATTMRVAATEASASNVLAPASASAGTA